ncbi:MAG: metallophosphoesterase family protein [Hoeflea sp.]|uniref:metallophosphoesterase family protein n=1 Tax=Hoeflea sp. TaxID=1940281 RepID=UPI003EF7C034
MTLTYAIGDVHGRRDLLAALLNAIGKDIGSIEARIVFLGDIIDRGPESRQCLDLVTATLEAYPGSRLILGNHEEFLLTFLDAGSRQARETAIRRWLPNGGSETLHSYGFEDPADLDRVARQLASDNPEHIAALRDASWMDETDEQFFVHGGIDPHRPLDEQDPTTTRWIRNTFLDFKGPLPKIIVHGHTMTDSSLPELHANRVALDTGAVYSGHLTCGIFAGDAPPRFLATDDHGAGIEVSEVCALDCR